MNSGLGNSYIFITNILLVKCKTLIFATKPSIESRYSRCKYNIRMKQEEIKTRNRRTNEQLDRDVMSELEKLVAKQGFGNVNLSTLTKAAGGGSQRII